MSDKRNSDIFEYAFTRKEFKQRMWSYLFMYIALRVVRIVLLLTVGAAYYATFWGGLALFLSGIVFGMAIITVIYYRKAILVRT